jgi:hypothetical protein
MNSIYFITEILMHDIIALVMGKGDDTIGDVGARSIRTGVASGRRKPGKAINQASWRASTV